MQDYIHEKKFFFMKTQISYNSQALKQFSLNSQTLKIYGVHSQPRFEMFTQFFFR